jgi:DNA-binding winged helix-turn-helix (wHTH) protein
MAENLLSRRVRFSDFEVDLRSGEIRKCGRKVRLQEKPFQLLALLLEHPGELITREEARRKLWPADTFVDFDHSLGTAISKLRLAVSDSPQDPRFIETVASRGYRFIAPVESVNETPTHPAIVAGEPFGGETDTIAAVFEHEPDWQVSLPTSAKIRNLLRRCMQKDSQRSVRSIGGTRIEIGDTLAASANAEPSAPVKNIRVRRSLLWGVAFLILAAVTSIVIWNRKSSFPINSGTVSRIAITLPADQPLAGLEIGSALALSPDGTYLVYAAHNGGLQQLYLRPLAGLEAKPIQGTEGAVQPFFSPDGQNGWGFSRTES